MNEREELTLIDFPQMVSAAHANAEELFSRDAECVLRFFTKKLGYRAEDDPKLGRAVRPDFAAAVAAGAAAGGAALDEELRASGFKTEHQAALERCAEVGRSGGEERRRGGGRLLVVCVR